MASVKASVTIQDTLRDRLQEYPNKSKILNQALELYFHKKTYMKKAENNRLEQVTGVISEDHADTYTDHLLAKYK